MKLLFLLLLVPRDRDVRRPGDRALDALGRLSVGAEANVAALRGRDGPHGFIDSGGNRRDGGRKIECELTLTLRAGEVVWDLNGIAALSPP